MKKIKAFTLIETLIVIVIFCIGILTVLIGLSQTLKNKEYANTQIKSAFFAREGIELMFNLRDANYHKELPWNCIFKPTIIDPNKVYDEDKNPFCNSYLEPGKILKISMGSGNEYIHVEEGELADDFDKNLDDFQIYFHTGADNGFTYNHVGNDDEKTGFARYLIIKKISTDEGEINNDKLLNDRLLKIESHVLYKKGTLTGDKVMETFIGNYEFNQ